MKSQALRSFANKGSFAHENSPSNQRLIAAAMNLARDGRSKNMSSISAASLGVPFQARDILILAGRFSEN
jgi:hypothetical protein